MKQYLLTWRTIFIALGMGLLIGTLGKILYVIIFAILGKTSAILAVIGFALIIVPTFILPPEKTSNK